MKIIKALLVIAVLATGMEFAAPTQAKAETTNTFQRIVVRTGPVYRRRPIIRRRPVYRRPVYRRPVYRRPYYRRPYRRW